MAWAEPAWNIRDRDEGGAARTLGWPTMPWIYLVPEEFEQLSPNGAGGTRSRRSRKGGTVLDASFAQG
jgi:hypothetical protein